MTFRPKDPRAAAEKERAILATVEQRLAEMDRKRPDLLLADDPTVIDKHDAEADRLRRAAGVHRERIAALGRAQREQREEGRERQKLEAMAVLEKDISARVAAAERFEKSLLEFCAAFAGYDEACRSSLKNWRADLFPPIGSFSTHSRESVSGTIARIANRGGAFLVKLSSLVGPIAEPEIASAARLIEEIRQAPLPRLPADPDPDDQFEEVEAA